jgi:hypothetical protein
LSAYRGWTPRDADVHDSELWWRLHALRTEWLNHALSSAPADRGAAEDAITRLYALLGHAPPRFAWVDSPAAAARMAPPPDQVQNADGPWYLENRMAWLVSELRHRMDRRIGSPPTCYRSIVDIGVRDPLRRLVRDPVAGMVRAALPDRIGLCWYGQHEADWVAYYDAHQRIVGTRFARADAAQLALWTTLVRSCGWWWPRADVCAIAERPLAVRTEPVDDDARLHHATGPAIVFPDGWAVHAWHGTRVPCWVIDGPTVALIARERNVEVRRCAIERIGWAAFIERAGLTLVRQAPDPGNPGCELRLYDLPYQQWGAATRLLLAVNGSVERDGTRRWYGLRVPPWFDDPIDAAGWSYGLTGAQYAGLLRRT